MLVRHLYPSLRRGAVRALPHTDSKKYLARIQFLILFKKILIFKIDLETFNEIAQI